MNEERVSTRYINTDAGVDGLVLREIIRLNMIGRYEGRVECGV